MALWFVSPPAFAQTGTNEAGTKETGSKETGSKETGANETDLFQSRIKAAASNFSNQAPFKNLSAKDRARLTEFVVANTLFVILHELGHAAITEMGLPVLGRPEDAADSFAAVGLIRIGSGFTHRVLTDAAKGWFLSDRRDRETDDTVAFYDEHGLDQQRAYQIVCLMVGSDEEKFKDLAEETKLPKERQETCVGDFSNAAYSWDLVLKPHVRTPDQPETEIRVIYGEAKGRLAPIADALRSIKLLEAVGVHSAEAFAWPALFTLEAQSCGFPNARWDLSTHKLFVCYELAADFAELYRAYGLKPMQVRALPAAKKKRSSR
jgi:Putative metallopeptidase